MGEEKIYTHIVRRFIDAYTLDEKLFTPLQESEG
jgi:hypothetical protein